MRACAIQHNYISVCHTSDSDNVVACRIIKTPTKQYFEVMM